MRRDSGAADRGLRSDGDHGNESLLLISSSVVHGFDYLEHPAEQIRDVLVRTRRVLFVSYALRDTEAYARKVRERFERMGFALDSIHDGPDPRRAVEGAESLFLGGGNTFRLLKALRDANLLEPIRRRVAQGMPYIGSSAGTNVACPTIRTTNDMPIVELPSLEALGLVSFQINPHYVDPDPGSTHQGETREERLQQYLEENERPVVGLREGAMLRVESGRVTVLGTAGARVFRRGQEPQEVPPGTSLIA